MIRAKRDTRGVRPAARPTGWLTTLFGALRPLATLGLTFVLCGTLLLAPTRAAASPETLRRAFGNIVNGPLDMLLSPVTGMLTLATNIADIDDSAADLGLQVDLACRDHRAHGLDLDLMLA